MAGVAGNFRSDVMLKPVKDTTRVQTKSEASARAALGNVKEGPSFSISSTDTAAIEFQTLPPYQSSWRDQQNNQQNPTPTTSPVVSYLRLVCSGECLGGDLCLRLVGSRIVDSGLGRVSSVLEPP